MDSKLRSLAGIGACLAALLIAACSDSASEPEQAAASSAPDPTNEVPSPASTQAAEPQPVVIEPTPIDPPVNVAQVPNQGLGDEPATVGQTRPATQQTAQGDINELIMRAYTYAGLIWHSQYQDQLLDLGLLHWEGGLAPPPIRERSQFFPYQNRVVKASLSARQLLDNWRQIRERARDYFLSEGYGVVRAEVLTDAVCELANWERDLERWELLDQIFFHHYNRIRILGSYVGLWRIDPNTFDVEMAESIPLEVQEVVIEHTEAVKEMEARLALEQNFLRPAVDPNNPVDRVDGQPSPPVR
ncbi:MAG: hypothetical protein AAGB51_09950 [Planctomycetota bacterium]